MEWLVQFGIAGAVVATVVLFLRFLREERTANQAFLANHLSKHTQALDCMMNQLSEMSVVIRKCPGPRETPDGDGN